MPLVRWVEALRMIDRLKGSKELVSRHAAACRRESGKLRSRSCLYYDRSWLWGYMAHAQKVPRCGGILCPGDGTRKRQGASCAVRACSGARAGADPSPRVTHLRIRRLGRVPGNARDCPASRHRPGGTRRPPNMPGGGGPLGSERVRYRALRGRGAGRGGSSYRLDPDASHPRGGPCQRASGGGAGSH